MITNNLLKMVGTICSIQDYEGTAEQTTFVNNNNEAVTIGVRMPSANDASVYAKANRTFDYSESNANLTVTSLNTAQDDLSPESYTWTGATICKSEIEGSSVDFNDGKLSFTYQVTITNEYSSNLMTVRSLVLYKKMYSFEYDPGYGDWSPHLETRPFIYSMVNFDEPIELGASESKTITIKEVVDANV